MSLTEHARAPFALVDELNQGMDQRAERCVHNELVARRAMRTMRASTS